MKFTRFAGNPILSRPRPDHPWEDLAVSNPAALVRRGLAARALLYRGGRIGAGVQMHTSGWPRVAMVIISSKRVGEEPVLGPSVEGFDGATIQDPRITKMDEWYYVTYAARHYPFGQFLDSPELASGTCAPRLPRRSFPHYLANERHAHQGLAMTRELQDLDSGRLDHRSAAGRPRRRFCFPRRLAADSCSSIGRWNGSDLKYGTEHACAWIKQADDLMGLPPEALEQAAD